MKKTKLNSFFLMLLLFFPLVISAQNTNCIDLSNLNAPYIHCTYGTYSYPYAHSGIVDGRHTVITEQNTDPETDGGLNMIPPGESYSVRLGNSEVGAQAESISCDIVVDTAEFDLLILKYAAVMQDPGHTPAHQPRFKFDILNVNNQQIDPECLSADFIANPNLGWNVNEKVLWKDWTNVGVDISSFQGQTIRVRLTTYDCSESGHFGYAYFVLACGNKRISVDACGYTSYYTFSAPYGFNYNWYWLDDPSHTISTDRIVNVPAGVNRELRCHVSYTENSSCGFDLYSTTEFRFPISGFSIQETNCPQTFHFVNESAISNDGVNPNGTGTHCDNTFWDFGDGHTSHALSPIYTYTTPGDFTVMQVAGLNNFECADTTYHSVSIQPNAIIDTMSCDFFFWNGVTYTESGIYSQSVTTSQGCDSLVTIHLTVSANETNQFDDFGCDEYVWNDVRYYETGQYQQLLQNQTGCDSLVTLNLDMEYDPIFRIKGNPYPIAGTEEAYTMYLYEIEFDNPLCRVDSIRWTVGSDYGFDIQPVGDGKKANLYLYAFSMDSIELKAFAYNRCGVEEYSFWFHTSYYDIEENEAKALFDVFPNPNSGEFKLRFHHAEGRVSVKVCDFMGVVAMERNIRLDSATEYVDIDLKGRPDGVYFVVVNLDGKTYIRKCVINSKVQ